MVSNSNNIIGTDSPCSSSQGYKIGTVCLSACLLEGADPGNRSWGGGVSKSEGKFPWHVDLRKFPRFGALY